MAPGGHGFRLRDADRIDDVVRPGGEVAATGLEVLLLGPDGRITADYRFPAG